jgi:hypothetical protein
MIAQSVILPMFRAAHIGWLPLEGLCRQAHVDFGWELIIAEEQHNGEVFGEAAVMSYRDRLRKAGCREIKYLPIESWIPLGEKYHLMAQHVDQNSKIWVQNSADYYPAPQRLWTHQAVFKSHPAAVLHLPSKAIHYHIGQRKAVLQDTGDAKRKDHVIGRAVLMDVARYLPANGPRHGCDSWEYRNLQAICKLQMRKWVVTPDTSTNYTRALSTFGFNNLTPPGRLFEKYPAISVYGVRKRLPDDVWAKLNKSADKLRDHVFLGRGKRKKK